MVRTEMEVWTPPYTSFTTLLNTISRMAEEGGVPSRVDHSYLSNMPGGVRSTFLASLRSLGLVDDELAPTLALFDLVKDEDARKQLMREIVESAYADVLRLPPTATQDELEDAFRDYGVSGSTLRKAIAFFLAAARYSELRVSPHFRLPRAESTRDELASAAGRGEELAGLDPFIVGLVRALPAPGEVFPADRQEAWFDTAHGIFRLLFKTGGKPSEARRPRAANAEETARS